ncbi:glutathione ABC transporter substrate-binding protein [Ramlibacter rhizophilus]|uniref:Glutathione ABC transporter substrate-binding protein n=1 Tax=Ramlibacter rhizophilus TaxID=1781167 RepID=A0A4Z0C0G4_9BURK|nr:glutathione ABC transporter substrate-binding protein [Ramlibacter rhizophilus]TFZ05023.1 glutathione ABC transporter substrate-binding protein [Ramlibacter rhizophilus]
MTSRRAFHKAAVASAALAMAGSALAQPKPRTGGTLTYAAGSATQTLDPQFITDVTTFRGVGSMYEALTKQDENGEIGPGLALSWTVSPDKRTWTFKLRPGVTFHDGTPFNAQAVKFTFDRLLNPATGSPRRSTLAMVESTEVVDDLTFRLTTKAPFAPLLAQLSAYNAYILSPTHVQKEGANFSKTASGTGPFKLQSWQPGEKLVVVRNDKYWGEKAKLDSVVYSVVPEDSARTLLLLSGQADVISELPYIMVKKLSSLDAVKVVRKPGYRTIYLGMNLSMPPFNDIRVRQAVAHAVNKPALVQGMLNGIGTLGGSLESSVIDGTAKDLPPYPYDPVKAKKLLAEAGFPNGFSTDFMVTTGRYNMDRQVAEAIQGQLAAVGIKANIQSPEFGAYLAALNGGKVPLFMSGKGSPTGDMDFTQALLNHSTGRMNYFKFKDPEVDRLIDQQRVAVDPKERQRLLTALQTKVYQEAPHITLYYEDQVSATRSNVHGVKVYVNEFIDFSKAWKA